MTESFIRYEKQGSISILTMNRPATRNAVGSIQDCREFVASLDCAQNDAELSCIVLTGAGTAFSAGGDLKSIRDRNGIGPLHEPPDATRANYRRGVQSVVESLWNCEVPLLAAINGPAIGLGLDLACLCDIRIAADSANFASSFIRMGLVPGDGGAWILPRIIGISRATELILTGDSIDSQAALAMGLISRSVPGTQLLTEALQVAQRIVANPRRALRLSKRLLRQGQEQRLSDALELAASFQALAHETQDHLEAVDAFFQKRPPFFTGG
jgi:2-(1,2-epoxy-1,2-dihydrophenyl)acetyl-CoA isomerase